ncbi:hypothetical protein [Rhodopirellula sp. MGV]|uniref:hypothetical protein n=1 Tax=Rhodopirellula sp. MGV TaxID=2023130 RepID=UPI000B96471F|nr:hypothetical protein [Rhodopirellula sp. MGV]
MHDSYKRLGSACKRCSLTIECLPIVFVMFLFSAGCTDSGSVEPETDEAMKRALKEGVSVKTAASYFSYRSIDDEQADVTADSDGYGNDSSESSGASGESVPSKRRLAVYDYFRGMDAISKQVGEGTVHDALLTYGEEGALPQRDSKVVDVELNESEMVGRNTWMAWCAGNEGFWDWLATDSLGFIDLVKLIDTRQRNLRFRETGLINEPEMDRRGEPSEFGIWLDTPQDPRIRQWRSKYLSKTFQQISEGRHKSQIGLSRRVANGDYSGELLYKGDPQEYEGRRGYEYPSEYCEELDESEAAFLNSKIPPPDMYGISSGVIGLRLFPNPFFDSQAKANWDSERFYNDKSYYSDPKLVRPFRVGMSCAFCHTSFHPLRPPSDENYPQWKNLSGNIGAQYLSMRATVGAQLTPDQFVYHLLESQPRGTIDTSLIASDSINNPNTMNAVFGLKQRAYLSLFNPKEKISKASAQLPSLWGAPDQVSTGGAADAIPEEIVDDLKQAGLYDRVKQSNENPRHVPRILLDGSDSIGTFGALARVYLNIGTYWEQWNQLHQVVIGFESQKPFKLNDCDTNSVYWNATKQRVPGLRDYFLKITPTMPLLSTPNASNRMIAVDHEKAKRDASSNHLPVGKQYEKERALHVDLSQLERGRQVFAKNCIVCHSSIQPESMKFLLGEDAPEGDFDELIRERERVRLSAETSGEFWEHDPAQWFENEQYARWASAVVDVSAFWSENYLSTDYRIPISLVGTNSSRAMGTNGLTSRMWEDFASESYRMLPSPGAISFFNPYAGESGEYQTFMPRHKTSKGTPSGGGGTGFYRVPSLMSIWATAPFLHNNSLGLFNNDPSVNGRLEAFDDGIRKLLWPERRLKSSSYNGATEERLRRDHGLIWRTTQETYLAIDAKRVPYFARRLPWIDRLYKKPFLGWIHSVRPLWLPSLILFLGSLVLLLVRNHKSQKKVAIGIAAVAILFVIGFWFAKAYPQNWLSNWLAQFYPWWLVPATLVFVAVLIWLPLSRWWMRRISYLQLIAALLIGAGIYFNAGSLGDVRLGPIPAGTPVNLLSNFNPDAPRADQIAAARMLTAGLAEIESRHLDTEAATEVMKSKIAPTLMSINKCPDFVMDRGHYFPWFRNMTDDDKNALIELLKTL